jgi:hypothetical protein
MWRSGIALVVCLALLTGCGDRESYTDRVEGIPLLVGVFQSYSSERDSGSPADGHAGAVGALRVAIALFTQVR